MSMFSIFGVSGSAVSAQSQRLNVVASNLANADAVAGPDGQAYKARQVVFQTVPMGSDSAAGVKVRSVIESEAPMHKVHNPTHPMADAQGYVTQSNVNTVEEMVNMISASRAYQNNVEVMNTAKSLLLKTLQMGQ
ncbi:MAG: flagellar basal body rod protein FlgC [Rhodoferax sp.]|jgi:flagellar basal-body rod protein FlgC|nr:flagellar basal body rod protein FlgC [Rhodoferax sp.]MBP9928253.1 flagellar basal body rod protein FlgC [Rhodoferax sp.]HQX58411.1 flagellar basal body rod protein FlgC [Burkholderiaceae bacterium]HQZ08192.1 flagellar basal body rod protein FlgC [Burkholderiaceae bacterium]HRA61452.1 flagellar basal body rod protein FlgC [Burkholderiaceae bacterium]